MDGTLCGMRLPRSLELRGRNQDRHDSHVPLTRRSKGPCISLLRPQEQSATNWVASCTREAFSHSSEGRNKSEIKVSERGLLLEALRTICSCLAHFSCCQQSRHPWLADPPLPWLPQSSHGPSLGLSPLVHSSPWACVQISLFFQGHQPHDWWPTLLLSDLIFTTSAKALFPNKVTFTGPGVQKWMELWGNIIQPPIAGEPAHITWWHRASHTEPSPPNV